MHITVIQSNYRSYVAAGALIKNVYFLLEFLSANRNYFAIHTSSTRYSRPFPSHHIRFEDLVDNTQTISPNFFMIVFCTTRSDKSFRSKLSRPSIIMHSMADPLSCTIDHCRFLCFVWVLFYFPRYILNFHPMPGFEAFAMYGLDLNCFFQRVRVLLTIDPLSFPLGAWNVN